jgi:hypothetical protein
MALVLAAATVLLLAGIVALLRVQGSDQLEIVVGGMAGAATASIAMLVRPGGLVSMQDTFERHGALAVFVPALAGLAAGGFSVLLAVGLFSSPLQGKSLTSGAIFGGLYGLLLGGWANRILGAQASTATQTTIVEAALSEVDRQLRAPQQHRYTGRVLVAVDTTHAQTLVVGSLLVRFVPQGTESPHSTVGSSREWTSGALQISEGATTDFVSFDLSVIPDNALTSVPRAREVTVPASAVSEVYEFTLALDSANRTVAADSTPSVVLLSVAQGGRTVQLIEIPVSLGP